VLGRGDATKALTVRAHKFSGKAAEKIAAAGGTAEVLA
jgi:large subunit ribosomal protein L15